MKLSILRIFSGNLIVFQVQNRDFVVAVAAKVAVKIHQLPRTASEEVVTETTARFLLQFSSVFMSWFRGSRFAVAVAVTVGSNYSIPRYAVTTEPQKTHIYRPLLCSISDFHKIQVYHFLLEKISFTTFI